MKFSRIENEFIFLRNIPIGALSSLSLTNTRIVTNTNMYCSMHFAAQKKWMFRHRSEWKRHKKDGTIQMKGCAYIEYLSAFFWSARIKCGEKFILCTHRLAASKLQHRAHYTKITMKPGKQCYVMFFCANSYKQLHGKERLGRGGGVLKDDSSKYALQKS